MSVVPLLVFCSLLLGGVSILLFLRSVGSGDHEHADRLSLLPLEDDAAPRPPSTGTDRGAETSNPKS